MVHDKRSLLHHQRTDPVMYSTVPKRFLLNLHLYKPEPKSYLHHLSSNVNPSIERRTYPPENPANKLILQ